jgi:serine/threonine protein phosphatase 1
LKFFDRFLRREARPPVALPDRRVFAIGDIHGCDHLLGPLIKGIFDTSSRDSQPPMLVFLGDYVDRGPASNGVIDRLVRLRADGHEARFLCGNHEEAMLKFMADVEAGLAWPSYGGKATMASYGVGSPADETDLEGWRRSQAAFKTAVPQEHMRFMWSLEDRVELGDYLFVHAGVRPGKSLSEQKVHDLRWIREPFLSDRGALEKIVVHGHTPDDNPYADSRRIGVDTWAYRTGVLTAAELTEGEPRFLQSRGKPGDVVVGWLDRGERSVA